MIVTDLMQEMYMGGLGDSHHYLLDLVPAFFFFLLHILSLYLTFSFFFFFSFLLTKTHSLHLGSHF